MARLAIIGAGITGLGAARELHDRGHDVQVFEADSRIGGHTHTVKVTVDGRERAIDTGFIVYNERTYPNFIALLDRLGIQRQATTMGFSVTDEGGDFEYAGTNLATLAPSWKLKFSFSHWRMIRDIVRFNRRVKADLKADQIEPALTLGDYLARHRFSNAFVQRYLLPMGAAIWSTPESNMREFEALFFARFFYNHGLLEIQDRPQWFTLIGGSQAYLEPLTAPFADNIRCAAPVARVTTSDEQVNVTLASGETFQFDGVVMACHSNQTAQIVSDPTPAQAALLNAVPYLDNEVVMHTDASLMPAHRSCWAAWNYMLQSKHPEQPLLTYYMNELMCLNDPVDFFVTVNPEGRIDPTKVLSKHHYAHPQFSPESPAAQAQLAATNAGQRVVLAGAWARNGFHEDGYTTGLEAAAALDASVRG